MSGKDKLISVDHLKWNVGGIKCGTLSVDYLNWILDREEPAVDAVPVRHGKWTVTPIYIKCSECGESFMLIPQNYCPHCGAKMDEEKESNHD